MVEILFSFFFSFPQINFCKCIFSTAVKPLIYAVLNKKEIKSGFKSSVSIQLNLTNEGLELKKSGPFGASHHW